MTTRDDHIRIAFEKSPLKTLPFEIWHGRLDLQMAIQQRHPKLMAAAVTGTSEIPPSTVYTIKKGDRGIVVWSVQKTLNVIAGAGLETTGIAGRRTDHAIRNFQESRGLWVDGLFGPRSSAQASDELDHGVNADIPAGLLKGQKIGESSRLHGAVSWLSPGGADCSLTMRRIFSKDFGDSKIEHRAFNGNYQTGISAQGLENWARAYEGKIGTPTTELRFRCSAQRHNYPAGADALAAKGPEGLSDYYHKAQEWVELIGVSFDDGVAVLTPYEWMQFYAMGASEHNHEGLVTKYVEDWTP